MRYMVNEIHTNFKAEWSLRLADCLTGERILSVMLGVSSHGLSEDGGTRRQSK